MAEITTRHATSEDADVIAAIHVASWRHAYRGLISQTVLDSLDVERRATVWRRMIIASTACEATAGEDGPAHQIVVAERDGMVLGWCTFGAGREEPDREIGELSGIYVHPDSWSNGVGYSLMNVALEGLRSQGFRTAFLWVLAGNDRAISFYLRSGWTASGESKVGSAGGASGLLEERYQRDL